MKNLNKKATGEANLEFIGKYLLWIAVAVFCGIAVYLLINKLTRLP